MKFGWSEEAMTAGAKEIGVSPSIVGYFPRKAAALVQAHPLNVPASFKQRAMLVDEIWHTTTDEDSDIDWYVKCTVLGGIYSTTEVYMLTDHSPEFCDTQLFLDDQVKDAFGFKKTIRSDFQT
ncbi:uncharacterized protein LOC108470055 [Gossypium arboreum]|uniref:uncharacterized protein LOC108470055 n=1 Tax=Gossypium arboreum TaxID=29729 RepID=UPI0022F1BF3E|nr:uncharacterized protein LOC108470055 [Gossypium arboreum]